VRYQTGVVIGSGGMGTVLRSFDTRLGRPVALKVLTRDDPELAERMLREARAQAGVDHPNVAKVYEVGHLDDGRPFIAMQLIEGRRLDDVAATLTIDDKVRLLATVAEAVHAAHVTGLVHRDLKPANILVEESAEGGLKPYVLDFGIARETAAPGLTVSGQVLGTPGYMAPEQASGQRGTVDRRADVFSLGVILYELLAGHQPFDGASPVDKLVALLNDEPTPLRQYLPEAPADLEAAVGACLERSPGARYPSAKALADDLRRYLAGEPVTVRRVTVIGRWMRRARRHPAIAAGVAVAATLVLAASGFAAATALSASRQAKVARELGGRLERIDATLRVARLLPTHDISRERSAVRAEMAAIERTMAGLGREDRRLGHLALGQGHLALGEAATARSELEAAWAAGSRSPEVSLALARALAELYRERLDAVRRRRDEESRRSGAEAAGRELSDPARAHLAAVLDRRLPSVLEVESLLALAEREPDAALDKAGALAALDPTSAEVAAAAARLRGEAYLQRAHELRWGPDRAGHSAALAAAKEAFEVSAATLRSDPSAHLGLCRAATALVELEADAGRPPAHSLSRAIGECGVAARVDAARAAPHVELAIAANTTAQFAIRRGQPPMEALELAARELAAALEAEPAAYEALLVAATTSLLEAERTAFERPREVAANLEEAIALLQRAEKADDRRPEAFHLEGNALLRLEDAEKALGKDAIPTVRAALAAFERALVLPDGVTRRTLNSVGVAYTDLGLLLRLRGEDPCEALAKALVALDRAVAMSPDYVTAHVSRGLAFWELGEHAAGTGGDPIPDLERAEASFARVLELDPTRAVGHTNSAGVLLVRARFEVRHGVDPAATLTRLRGHLETFRTSFPWDFHLDSAETALVETTWARQRGQAAAGPLARAARHAQALIGLSPEEASGEMLLAEVQRVRAGGLVDGSGRGRAALAATCRVGLEHAARALAVNPTLARALAARAALLAAQATLRTDLVARRQLEDAAREAARAALAAEPTLDDDAVRRLAR
jgi:eukaryotic-like serine/threonine-protein kinase